MDASSLAITVLTGVLSAAAVVIKDASAFEESLGRASPTEEDLP